MATGVRHQQALLPRWFQHKDVQAFSFVPSIKVLDTDDRIQKSYVSCQTTTSTSRDSVPHHTFNYDGKRFFGACATCTEVQKGCADVEKFLHLLPCSQLFPGTAELRPRRTDHPPPYSCTCRRCFRGRQDTFHRVSVVSFSGKIKDGQKARTRGPNYKSETKKDMAVKNIQRRSDCTLLRMERYQEAVLRTCPVVTFVKTATNRREGERVLPPEGHEVHCIARCACRCGVLLPRRPAQAC